MRHTSTDGQATIRALPRPGLPRSHALGLSLSGGLLSLSGLLLAAFRYAVATAEPFSAYPHPAWRYAVMVHVLAAPPFFFFVGSIWWRHVVRHWHHRRRRLSGATVVGVVAAAASTGYALYFAGADALVRTLRIVHAVGGVVGILCYSFHAVLGWRALRERDQDRTQDDGQRSLSVLS